MTARRTPSLAVAAMATVAVVGLAGCTPGSDAPVQSEQPQGEVSTDVASMGDVTLSVWDQEVRGGQNAQIEALNAAFEDEYPNVTIERNSQSFDDLVTTLRLAISSDDAPDVVQVNNARGTMGQFVSGGQILDLSAYAEAYGWADRFDESVLAYSSYTDDATGFGEGSVYGLPQVGEIVGVFYSKEHLAGLGIEVPTDLDSFEAAMQASLEADVTPLLLGNVEQWPAAHVFGPIQGALAAPEEVRLLGFGNEGATWQTPENLEAAETMADWGERDLIDPGANGTDYDAAWHALVEGEGTFLMGGSWLAADLADAMGDDAGFFTLTETTTGGTGVPFSVTSASDAPDAAAAYVDFITSEKAMQVIAENGGLPAFGSSALAPEQALLQDVYAAYETTTQSGQLLPYLDYATPTFGDTIGAALQELIDGRISAEEFLERLESDYADFTS